MVIKLLKKFKNNLKNVLKNKLKFNSSKNSEQNKVEFEQLNDWLDKQIEKKELNNSLNVIKREIKAKLIKLEELIKKLEYASLKNPDVYPERALNIMEGNRKAYIQKIQNFLSEIKLPEKYEDINYFLEETSQKIDALALETQKNYFILKEFFNDEITSISNKLKEIDSLVADSRKKLENTIINKIKEVKEKINEYYIIEKEVADLRKKAEIIEQTKLELYEKRSKIEDKINKIKSTQNYQEFQELALKKEELKEQIKDVEKKIHSLFSKLEPALKKYHNKTKSNLIEKYLEDYTSSLIDDKELKIKKELEKIIDNLDNLELKPDKLKRLKEAFKSKDLQKIENIRNELLNLKSEYEDLSKRVKNHTAKLNLKEQEAWLINIDKNIEEENKKMEEIENELERRNLNLIKQQISKILKEIDKDVDLIK